MFYSEAILSRRGPLAKVWLAAHMERKLSKTQTLQTDIEQSVGAILGQEVEVMALRLSGQLLLGVVRIYSRKAKYLLDDCNEAILRIKMAFRPGLVDMTEDQLAVNKNAITLQGSGIDLDALLPDINWEVAFEDRPMVEPQNQHVARAADITLSAAEELAYDFVEPDYGLDLGPSDGIGSQDFDIDLGISFGDNDDLNMSVEQGRDAVASRFSLDSDVLGKPTADGNLDLLSNASRQMSEHPFAPDVDMFDGDFGGDIDLGITFDDDPPKTPVKAKSPSRASSPLTEVPMTPPPEAQLPEVQVTPKKATESPSKVKRKAKEKKQIIDGVTELADGPGAKIRRGRDAGLGAPMTKDVSNILTEQHFLPRSSIVMNLLGIREDPIAHFLPTKVTPEGTFFCAAPPGLAPELAELFMRPLHLTSARRRPATDESPSKKRKLMTEELNEEVEQGRRAPSVAASVLPPGSLGRGSVVPDLDFPDNTGLDLNGIDISMPDFEMGGADMDYQRSKSVALSRMSTPTPEGNAVGDDETYADLICPISIFDEKSQLQSQATLEKEEAEATAGDKRGSSKNTMKALGIVRKELHPTAGHEGQEKFVSFKRISHKATRRAASAFFFELLVLGTRDCVQLTQASSFENIEIRAKDKLWEHQRHASVAPSLA